jgi:hypothetical protein
MRLGVAAVVSIVAFMLFSAGVPQAAAANGGQDYLQLKSQHVRSPIRPVAGTGQYQLLAWSELGMHCIDGKDYSIFAVLPPYNIVRAQLILMGEPPQRVSSGVTITYEAMSDPSGSINTISSTKTNFWSYVQALFLTNPPPDIGLTGNSVQNRTPHPLTYDSKNQYWTADGIPTVPYDDQGNRNAYGMVKIVARDLQGNLLATAGIVISVSDELTCSKCHASDSDQYAKPKSGWEHDPDPAKDVKLNAIKLHDDRVDIRPYLSQLQQMGYFYQDTLYSTAKSGTLILCAACHSTNALGAPGIPGIYPMTSAMHIMHGPVLNLDDNITLNDEDSPEKSCYLCHPGLQTKCERGAMNKIGCKSCHGNLSMVGNPKRRGWLDLPACQMCHTDSQRYTTTFSWPGRWRRTSDTTFATNPDKPVKMAQLYRYSTGHGNLYCSGCHGSPHAEFPTLQPNDNLYSQNLQGHEGKIAECNVCHTQLPVDLNNGPHGIHTVGQSWVDSHGDYVDHGGSAQCTYCHGSDYRGSFLSATSMARSFQTDDGGHKTYNPGDQVGCYDCHDGPGGG